MGKRSRQQVYVTQKRDGSWYCNLRTPAVKGANGEELQPSAPVFQASTAIKTEQDARERRAERKKKAIRFIFGASIMLAVLGWCSYLAVAFPVQ